MLFTHPSIAADPRQHFALVNEAELSPPATLRRLIASAGIDIREFSSRFETTAPRQEAHEIVAHFQNWLRDTAPDHPVLSLHIMHVGDAITAAGIGQESHFSTETAAYERDGNSHCPEDQEKWFAWIERARALHKCNWRDDNGALLRDICDAIDKNARILVLERLG
jgi:hypothetical protein